MKTISTIIAELRQRQQEIAGALKELERYTQTPDTAAKIVAAVRKTVPKKKHWTQTAKGRKRMAEIGRARHRP